MKMPTCIKMIDHKSKQNANNDKNAGQVSQNAYRKRFHKIEC